MKTPSKRVHCICTISITCGENTILPRTMQQSNGGVCVRTQVLDKLCFYFFKDGVFFCCVNSLASSNCRFHESKVLMDFSCVYFSTCVNILRWSERRREWKENVNYVKIRDAFFAGNVNTLDLILECFVLAFPPVRQY